MDGWTDGWIDGWMQLVEGWLDRWMDKYVKCGMKGKTFWVWKLMEREQDTKITNQESSQGSHLGQTLKDQQELTRLGK